MSDETKVEKAKFDALLRKMIAMPPTSFRDVVEEPKRTQGGDIKLSSKRKRVRSSDEVVRIAASRPKKP